MLTQWSLVCKCLLKSKTEVYILYKRVWFNQETESRNEGGGATLSEAAREYFGAKWRLAYCYKELSVDPKISCMILQIKRNYIILNGKKNSALVQNGLSTLDFNMSGAALCQFLLVCDSHLKFQSNQL